MSVVMTRRRQIHVKNCQFRKFKEWARDYLHENDIDQFEIIEKQLKKLRNEDLKTLKKPKKPQVQISLSCTKLITTSRKTGAQTANNRSNSKQPNK